MMLFMVVIRGYLNMLELDILMSDYNLGRYNYPNIVISNTMGIRVNMAWSKYHIYLCNQGFHFHSILFDDIFEGVQITDI